MGLSYDQLFPGRFIKAGEFSGKQVTMTIKAVFLDELEKEDSTTHTTPIVTFQETTRQWVLIKTNAQCLVAMWGPETDNWIGKRVTLYPERDASGLSDSGLCIRVKGSPDIDAPVTATIKLPRRRPQTRRLVPTKQGKSETPPQPDTDTGEYWPLEPGEPPFAVDGNGEVTDAAEPEPEEPRPVMATGNPKASQRQLAKIGVLMGERDIDAKSVQRWMYNQWEITSRAQLDNDQAGQLIEHLTGLPMRPGKLDGVA